MHLLHTMCWFKSFSGFIGFIPYDTQWGRNSYGPHFTDGENEALHGNATYWKCLTSQVEELRLEPKSVWLPVHGQSLSYTAILYSWSTWWCAGFRGGLRKWRVNEWMNEWAKIHISKAAPHLLTGKENQDCCASILLRSLSTSRPHLCWSRCLCNSAPYLSG